MQFKNYKTLVRAVDESNQLKQELISDPVQFLKKASLQSEIPDTKVYRMVVASLIVAVIVVIIGLLIMVLLDKTEKNQNILTIFTAICSTAIGALAGVLIPPKTNDKVE